jgi:hypothetical protein
MRQPLKIPPVTITLAFSEENRHSATRGLFLSPSPAQHSCIVAFITRKKLD